MKDTTEKFIGRCLGCDRIDGHDKSCSEFPYFDRVLTIEEINQIKEGLEEAKK